MKENETLKKEIYELKEKFNYSKILKGSFYNKESKWFPYCDSLWKLFSFDSMEGNIEQASSSAFIIPEDGVYVYFRYDDAKRVMMLWNTTDKAQEHKLERYAEMLKGYRGGRDVLKEETVNLNAIRIEPFSVRVIVLQ